MTYSVRISKRAKRICLKIEDGELVVVSPKRISNQEINSLISQHKNWVERNLKKARIEKSKQISITDGTVLQLFGKEHVVDFKANGSVENTEEYTKWLKGYAKKFMTTRVKAFASAMNLPVNKVVLRDQSTRWGSCSGKRIINLNWRLMFAPTEVMDYVIVHELAHLKEMNHSRKFWGIVKSIIPDYKNHRKWLRRNGMSLMIKS